MPPAVQSVRGRGVWPKGGAGDQWPVREVRLQQRKPTSCWWCSWRCPSHLLALSCLLAAPAFATFPLPLSLCLPQVGTTPAAISAFAALLAVRPDLVINAGTAGGFQRMEVRVGEGVGVLPG